MKTLIYIGASRLQVPGIRWAKDVGLRVIVTDSNPNAVGIADADGHEKIDGTDEDGLLTLARDLDAQGDFAGAYCGSDFGLAAVSRIGVELGTPACPPDAVALALNKPAALRAMKDAGVATPDGVMAKTLDAAERAAQAFGFPVIVKPTDSSGSRGVRTVNDADELKAAYDHARKFSNAVLVERIVDGHHIDINGLFVDGKFLRGGLFDRYFTPPPIHIPLWGHQPTDLSAADEDRAYAAFEAGARAMGIEAGPCKADGIWTADGPVMLEIAPRFHGDVSTSHITPLATGDSAVKAWFAHLAGARAEDYLALRTQRYAGWRVVTPDHGGAFDGIDGLDTARSLPGIDDISVLKKKGYRIDGVTDNLAVMAFIWGTGTDKADLFENLERARAALTVRMAP